MSVRQGRDHVLQRGTGEVESPGKLTSGGGPSSHGRGNTGEGRTLSGGTDLVGTRSPGHLQSLTNTLGKDPVNS